MKFSIPLSVFLVFSFLQNGNAQSTWTQKTNYPDNVSGATSFSIGNKGYIGMGWNPVQTIEFQEYDPLTNLWSPIANFPGTFAGHAVGFNINGLGYLGTGLVTTGVFSDEFWSYDSALNAWTQKADFGGASRSEASGFSLGGYGYIGLGWNNNEGFKNDFWRYDPINDLWNQTSSFPGTERISSSAFAIDGHGYIGFGYDSTGFLNDLWKYNPQLDQWSQVTLPPLSPRARTVSFVIGEYAYLGTGYSQAGGLYDFWRYDPTDDTWLQVLNLDSIPRQFAEGFTIGNKGYVGTGADAGAPYYNDFWEFDPDGSAGVMTNSNDYNVRTYPNPTSGKITIQLDAIYESIEVNISNILGQEISQASFNQIDHFEVEIDGVSGLYFVDINVDKGKKKRIKILKK
ncbi:MAG: T9SS type A sorting domain-containing protein [Crocinitomicaceae bacterium]|nr:T9SS type A sorting domain-containing protein [Crocinitomicaceae bacterium]